MTALPEPMLTTYGTADRPRAIALLLHGGQPDDVRPVTEHSLSWRRALGLARGIAYPLQQQGIATWVSRNRVIGWNGDGHGPITDARAALDEVRRRHGVVPVVLVGHSMGARVAVHAADDPSVVGVVGLAPWWPPGEPIEALTGRRLVAAHGRSDRITSFAATRVYVERASAVALSAELVDMGRVGHYMFRRVREWNRVAATGVQQLLD